MFPFLKIKIIIETSTKSIFEDYTFKTNINYLQIYDYKILKSHDFIKGVIHNSTFFVFKTNLFKICRDISSTNIQNKVYMDIVRNTIKR